MGQIFTLMRILRRRQASSVHKLFISKGLCLCALVGVSGLYAQKCGDIVTGDVQLATDLGPCPGDGLVVTHTSNLTIDLNGFSILGSGTGTGIRIDFGTNILVKGGGNISNFQTGVSAAASPSNGVEVRDTTFTAVGFGVFLGRCSKCRVIDNAMQGNGTGAGVSVSESSQIKVRGNQISGFVEGFEQRAGIGSSVTVVSNTLNANTEGVVVTPGGLGNNGFTFIGNTIAQNTGNGMRLVNSGGTLQGNIVTNNAGDGILIQSSFGHTLQDNIATGNGGRGIAQESPRSSGTFSDNEARDNNLFDLYWNGVGSSCWSLNLFNTSQPDPLPPCP
jgi:parallel beta-helix repeat protein